MKNKDRIHGTLTPSQQRRVTKTQQLIAAELPDLVRRNQLRHDARKEKTFSGALRRAIHGSALSPMKIAERTEIAWVAFSAFLTGERPLDSDAIDRLTKILKLKLDSGNGKPNADE